MKLKERNLGKKSFLSHNTTKHYKKLTYFRDKSLLTTKPGTK